MIRKAPSPVSSTRKSVNLSVNYKDFFMKKFSFLFDTSSLFYYALLILGVGVLWMAYAIFVNNFSVLYGWDYSSQYVTMAYGFRDMWYDFFETGSFPLYSFSTFLGTDNIGSNAYYGLFDPFLLPDLIFPRSWMPQMFVLSALIKGVVSALSMRAFLRYMEVSEGSSRLGGVVFAFSGYLNFMVGFPSYLSMAFTLPLILLGIEKVLQERKPLTLAIAIMLLGMISFFFLVVFLIFGALYALWRFVATFHDRGWKSQFTALGSGVFGVAIGLCLCAWVLLPSVRETSLSGRTSSIGGAYLSALSTAFQDKNLLDVLALLFMPVGGNAGRELQGLIGFFYPTCNYMWLPLAKIDASYNYDSWTSSLFCYTPIIILYFSSLIHSIRKGRWGHFAAFCCCTYLIFTNFAYYFFYAFAGDGYGRWYIVLVPLIIWKATEELDVLRFEKKSTLIGGSLLALGGTIAAFLLAYFILDGKPLDLWIGDGYAGDRYEVPATGVVQGLTVSLSWMIYYQIALVVIESGVFIFLQHRKDLWKVLFAFVTIEITISGNCSFFYGSMLRSSSWLGGTSYLESAKSLFDEAYSDSEDDYYRAYSDAMTDRNTNFAYGYNGTSHFHSLFNYDLASFARYSYITNNEGGHPAFGDDIVTKSWSAYYGNKRVGFDIAVGTKYYLVQDEGYPLSYDEYAANVPFGSTLVAENDTFRLYESSYAPTLGHKVEHYYAEGLDTASSIHNYSSFFHDTSSSSAAFEILRNEQVYLDGAILKDEDVEEVLSLLNAEGGNRTAEAAPVASYGHAGLTSIGNNAEWSYIETVHGDGIDYGYYAYNEELGINWSPGYFLTYLEENSASSSDPLNPIKSVRTFVPSSAMQRDFGKVVVEAKNESGYFNEEEEGAYFVMDMNIAQNASVPRIYFIGDLDNNDNGIIDEEEHNQVLCYDYKMLENWSSHRVRSSGDVFGFYVPGRTKYIVFCYKGQGNVTMSYRPSIYYQERSDFEENIAITKGDNALDNVHFQTDNFTFESHYSEPELVVTTLGYDAGWSLTGENGNETVSPKIFCLDGGLVGFVLPSGDWKWELHYFTPTLNYALPLAMIGVIALSAYELCSFLYDYKKMKKETADK